MGKKIVIVGAGPTGLLLAGDLLEAGGRGGVLERRAGGANLTRAFAVHARTMEQLQIRGVAAELAASGTTIDRLVLYGRAAIDLSRLPSRYPSLLITPQSRTEEVLTRRLHRLGGKEFEEQRNEVRQVVGSDGKAGIFIQRLQIDHGLAAVAAFAVDVLVEVQGQRPRPIEQPHIAFLQLVEIALRQVRGQGRERPGDLGRDQRLGDDHVPGLRGQRLKVC